METSTLIFIVIIGFILQSVGSFLVWATISKNVIGFLKKEFKDENSKSK